MKKRLLAGLIDFAIAALIQSILMFVFIMFPLLIGRLESADVIVLNLKIAAISMAYLIIRDILGKKSIGKRIVKLRITSTSGTLEPGFGIRLLRNVTWILGPIEILVLLVAKKRIGDMIAKTTVEETAAS